jgi:phage tail-like protein
MRGTLDGLPTPRPLAATLPAMLREDPMARGLCDGLDEVLAPVLLSLDAFPAYLDLATTPDDMVPWLAQWVGMSVDLGEDLDRQRELLGSAGALHAIRGTRRGIELAVQAATGMPAEVVETGSASWSDTPGGALPGDPQPAVVVVVRPEPDAYVDADRLDALVEALKPAHVQHRVQIDWQ